jgi:hypothetical protein
MKIEISKKYGKKSKLYSTVIVGVLSMVLILSIMPALRSQSSTASQSSPKIKWLYSLNVSCLNNSFCPSAPGPGLSTHSIAATFYADHTALWTEVYTTFDSSGQIVSRSVEVDQINYWRISFKTNDFIYVKGINTTKLFMNGVQSTTVRPIFNLDSGITAMPTSINCIQFIEGLGVSPPFCPEGLSIQITVQEVS